MKTRRLGVLLACVMAARVAVGAEALDRQKSFNIGPAPLATVLIEFSQQSGIQVAASDTDIGSLHSDGVMGTRSIREALGALLRGTGLGFTSVGNDTLAIRPEGVTSAGASGQNAAGSPAEPRGASADTARPAALPSVTITAPKPPDPQELVGDSLPKFLTTHAKLVGNTGQLARWHSGICVGTTGLTPDYNVFVSARVREVAVTVGAPAQPEGGGCTPNVSVVFTSNVRGLMQDLHTRVPALAHLNARQIETLAAHSLPIQAWNVIRPYDDSATASTPEGLVSGDELPNSRLKMSQGIDIVATVIVVDQHRVAGYSIGAVADYIAMLVLSRTQLRTDCSALPSILDLLSPSCGQRQAPTAITAGDLAFLRALYGTDLGKPTPLERGVVLENMRRQLTAH